MKKIILSSIIFAFLSSCGNSYYGYDQATWDNMSPEEKEKTISDVNKLLNHSYEVQSQSAETQSIIDRAGTYNR